MKCRKYHCKVLIPKSCTSIQRLKKFLPGLAKIILVSTFAVFSPFPFLCIGRHISFLTNILKRYSYFSHTHALPLLLDLGLILPSIEYQVNLRTFLFLIFYFSHFLRVYLTSIVFSLEENEAKNLIRFLTLYLKAPLFCLTFFHFKINNFYELQRYFQNSN